MVEFSVIMPIYNQAAFVRNAIQSLMDQSYSNWELIIVNDGSTDGIEGFIADFLDDPRVIYLKNESNEGLGYSLNRGIEIAQHGYIAYLPADDFYYANHLEILQKVFETSDNLVLVYTSINSDTVDSFTKQRTNSHTNGLADLQSLQLVQIAHKKTEDRWVTRSEWDSDDLFQLFFHKLIDKGAVRYIDQVTSKWVVHPNQRHRIISEDFSGSINKYRQYYQVKIPIKLKVSEDKFINEEEFYEELQTAGIVRSSRKPFKILLVGELSSNGERICAFAEQGHELYGLWMQDPYYSFFTVGHLPYGNVHDVPYHNWKEEVRRINPDIIYALQSFGAVPIAHEVLTADLGIPFIWHFKEGPSASMQRGDWDKLIDLFTQSDASIYINEEAQRWYAQFLPIHKPYFILDGDLPKVNYFSQNFSPKLSAKDGHIHTVIPGRVIGLTVEDIAQLAEHDIHVHLYVESYHNDREHFNRQALKAASDHFHVHKHCPPRQWVREFSQYDAGWLHCFDSRNEGDIRRAGWDDLNLPARMNTLAAAGVPMIQRNNDGHIVAMQRRVQDKDIGIFFQGINDLILQLQDTKKLQTLSDHVMHCRHEFSFDYHLPQMLDFFEQVIAHSPCKKKI